MGGIAHDLVGVSMKLVSVRLAPVAMLACMVAASPALAGGFFGHGGGHHGAPSSSGGGGSGATPVPEPADAALFGLGVAGVAIGRRFRRKNG